MEFLMKILVNVIKWKSACLLVQNAILNRQIAKIGHELDALALSEGSAKFLSEIKYKPSGNELFGRNFELSIEDGKIYYIKPEGQV